MTDPRPRPLRERVGVRGFAVFMFILAHSSFALGPHEILILANRNSPASMKLARDYAALRCVPECNLMTLNLPDPAPLEMSAADFNRLIRDPVQQLSRERGLDDHILAWVYSVQFPTRITASPALSLQGITFLKGQLPTPELVQRGTYGSPLFAGPDNPSTTGFPSQSLDVQRSWQGKAMPIPSMMLGFMGTNGNTPEEILACMQAGVRSDRTAPDGLVCIVTNTDVRTLARTWEFAPTARELGSHDVATLVTNAYPARSVALIGMMAGSADIPEATADRLTFRPGAMADHLTSFGAAFDGTGQTKITAWIRAGATAAAGTVVEPLSIWTKFPHARLFVHPTEGCTILESFFQSIRCPLQILIIGEPLAAPWAPRSTVSLKGLPQGPLTRRTTLSAEMNLHPGEVFARFMFLLDGRTLQPLGKSPEVTLDPAGLTSGRHKLRVVAYKVGSVRCQVFTETEFEVQ